MAMTTYIPHLVLPVGPRDHIRGPATAHLTLLEYGDYECPYCGAAYPVVEDVRRRMGWKLRFVYRHFPLTNVHPHAEQACQAVEASGAQGRFWEMHDALFANQDALEFDDLVSYAAALGLDVVRFGQEIESRRLHVADPRRLHERGSKRRQRDADLLRQRHSVRRAGGCRIADPRAEDH